MHTLVAWRIRARPPAERVDHVEIVDEGGRTVDRGPVVGPKGERGWDLALVRLGFSRVGTWQAHTGAHFCTVKRLEVPTSAKLKLRASCNARTWLTEDERATLDAIPFGAHELEDEVECEYQADHDGPHVALGQAGDSASWWLRWTWGVRDLIRLTELCDAEGRPPVDIEGAELWPCGLPAGHPGVCSWQLEGFFGPTAD